MVKWRLVASAAVLGGLPTNALAAEAATEPLPATVGIKYFLPKTSVKLGLDLILLKCDDKEIVADATVVLTATGGSDKAVPFWLSSEQFSSMTKKREFTLVLNENLAVASLNSMSENRGPAIAVGIFKAAAQIAGAFFGFADKKSGDNPAPARCNESTVTALEQAGMLRKAIKDRREALTGAEVKPSAIKEGQESIDILAAQLAAIEQSALKLSLSKVITPDAPSEALAIQWTMSDVRKWLARSPTDAACYPYHASSVADGAPPAANYCGTGSAAFALSAKFEATKSRSSTPHRCQIDQGGCSDVLVVVRPAQATVTITATGKEFGGVASGATLGTISVAMPQWGATSEVPVAGKKVSSRRLEMAFDAFGNTTTLKWTSDARAESFSTAAADAGASAATFVKAIKGDSDVDEMKSKIDQLETKHKLEDLEACESIRQAGGSCATAEDEA